MKLLTWNVNKAGGSRRTLWKMVEREDADILLLQEVTGIPGEIQDRYDCRLVSPRYFRGHNARFSTAVLSKGQIDATAYLESESAWVNKIHTERSGWIVGCKTTLDSGERFHVVSVHAPSFPIPPRLWTDVDVSGIKLVTNPRLWFTEILWALLRAACISDDANWIVGGDFNRSVKHKGGQEVIDRLKTLGLTDCLSHHHGGPVPTFQASRKIVRHQLDYCYVNTPLLDRLSEARVPGHEEVFAPKPRLSDHLPILCTFD